MGVSAQYPLIPGVPAPTTSKGGEIPEPPFATDAFRVSIRRPPSKAEILDLLSRVTEPSYHTPIIDDPRGSIAAYRQMACQFAVLADKGFRSQESAFYLPYPTQGDLPASSLEAATMLVTMSRSKDRWRYITVEIAAMTLFGPQGRRYVNAERIEWFPFDPNEEKTVEFISQDPGFVGNLEHLADANGLVTNPDGSVATDIVGILPLTPATNTLATILSIPNALSQIEDSGAPDIFSEDFVGFYVEILTSANAENLGRILRITGYEPASSGSSKRITVDDGPLVTQTQVALAFVSGGGGVFTNETAAARNDTANDITLLPAAPAVVDSYYFGAGSVFGGLDLTISTPGVGVWEITWKYWDGNAYVPFTGVVDNTVNFTAGGTNRVRWTIPSDWIIDTQDGITAFYANAELTSFTSLSAQPLGQIVYTLAFDPLVAESPDTGTGAVEWAIRDWIDLGVELTQIVAPAGGRDDTLRMLGEERGVFQQNGETDDTFRNRAARLLEVVSPDAINAVVNQAMAPFGFTGRAIDVSDGFDGWFYDVDAWDYADSEIVSRAIANDGAVDTEETTEAQNLVSDDMTLLPAAPAVGDGYRFGQTVPFSGVDIDITTPGIGDWSLEFRYFNGSVSTLLADIVDGTDNFKNVGIRRVTWTVPGDWDVESPSGIGPAFYVHAKVLAVSTTTQQPLGRQAKTTFEFPAHNDFNVFLSGSIGAAVGDVTGGAGAGESNGWFFVILPCLPSTLHFGFAWDINEPANILDGRELATAWDIMVWDGEPTDANAAYAALFDQINLIRTGGVGFTIIKDCNQNVPICP